MNPFFQSQNGISPLLPYQNHYHQNIVPRHGYYDVVNGCAWFYDTSVSYQELQQQNFRLTNMHIDQLYWNNCYNQFPE